MSTTATAALTLLVFWLPGWWGLGVLRIDGLRRFALAPLVTTFLCGIGAVVTSMLHVRWNLLSMVVTCVAAIGVARLAWRRSQNHLPRTTSAIAANDANDASRHRLGLRVVASVTAGALTILLPFAIGMGSPERSLNAWDAPFHLDALEYIRETGRASPLDILAMLGNGPHQGVYPTGWHSIAALIPVWPSRAVVFTVAAYLPLALAWSAGLALLTRSVFPENPSAAVLAPLLAATGAVPVYVMSTLGVVANAWALALAPAAAATVITAWRSRSPLDTGLAVACVIGLGLAHPGPVIALAVASLPVSGPAGLAFMRRQMRHARGRVLVAVGAVVTAAALVLALRHTALGFVLGLRGAASSGWPWSIFDVVNGSQGETVSSGVVVVVAAGVGIRLGWADRRRRAVVLGGAILLLLPIVADARLGFAEVLLRPWYSDISRLAPVAWALIVSLASHGITEGTRRLVASGRMDAGSRPQLAVPLVAAVCIVAVGVPTFSGSRRLAAHALSGSLADSPYISTDEQRMIDRLPREIDPTKAVLGSTYAGAAHLYGLIGQRVSLRNHYSEPDAAIRYISAHLADLGTDPHLCAALSSENIRYLYVDSRPSPLGAGAQSFLEPPPAGVALVDSGGSAAVYDVTACR